MAKLSRGNGGVLPRYRRKQRRFPARSYEFQKRELRRSVAGQTLCKNSSISVRHRHTGSAWRDRQEEFGPWQNVYDRFNRWNADGTIDNILDRLPAAEIHGGAINDQLWCVDGTILRAHRCAAGGVKNDPAEPADHALGRFPEGFMTKDHLLRDAHGHPLHFLLMPG